MTYTEHNFSLKSGFKKIVLTPDMVSVLNSVYTRFYSIIKIGKLNKKKL